MSELSFDEVNAMLGFANADTIDLGGGYQLVADAKPAVKGDLFNKLKAKKSDKKEGEKSAANTKEIKKTFDPISTAGLRWKNELLSNIKSDKKNFILSGIDSIDTSFRHWLRNQNLVILAARPSVGKTTLVLQIAENVALSGRSVFVISGEMSSDQLAARNISRCTKISMERLDDHDLSDADLKAIDDACIDLENLPIYVNDSTKIVEDFIEATQNKINELAADGSPPLGLIVVDYLQLLRAGEKLANKNLEVGHISKRLKEPQL